MSAEADYWEDGVRDGSNRRHDPPTDPTAAEVYEEGWGEGDGWLTAMGIWRQGDGPHPGDTPPPNPYRTEDPHPAAALASVATAAAKAMDEFSAAWTTALETDPHRFTGPTDEQPF